MRSAAARITCSLVMIAGCAGAAEYDAPIVLKCLEHIYGAHEVGQEQLTFDQKFDSNAEGGSFACELEITATSAKRAIEAFRDAVLYEDPDRILDEANETFVLNRMSDGTSSKLTKRQFDEFVSGALPKNIRAIIACSSTVNVSIYRGRGFSIGNGVVWFVGNDVNVRAVSMNLVEVSDSDVVEYCSRHL